MSTVLSNFYFLRPYALLAILPLLACLIYLIYVNSTTQNWRKICDAHLLPYLLINNQAKQRYAKLGLLSLIWLIATIALAGPCWQKLPQPIYRSGLSRMIAFDLSSHMLVQDIQPSRLERAKFKLLDILKKSNEGQTGLIVFSSEPFVVSPLTNDNATIANQVPVLSPNIMPTDGSNISWALVKAGQLMLQAGVHHGSILLITANNADNQSIAVARKLHAGGLDVSILAMGTHQRTPILNAHGEFKKDRQGAIAFSQLDLSSLKKVAEAGGGKLVHFTKSDEDIDTLLQASVTQKLTQQSKKTQDALPLWQDTGHWFILLILPFFLLLFRRGSL